MTRILLLEPNRLLARQIKAYLEARDYSVVVCEDAQTGIMAADAQRIDAVVIELLLSGHSGIEFLYEFRSYGEWRNIPAIIFTALAPHEIDMPADKLKELGVSASLYKAQTSLAKLVTMLERALKPVNRPA